MEVQKNNSGISFSNSIVYDDRVERTYKSVNSESQLTKIWNKLRSKGFTDDGGFNNLDRGWRRLIKRTKTCNTYFQINWRLDNEGNDLATVSVTKFKK